ncbi:MAG: alpha-L-fucosidase [Cyclobacteriaceae bacterium]|nr:alpha-L-fucosidase [Cyclobacteriaceae bacterium]
MKLTLFCFALFLNGFVSPIQAQLITIDRNSPERRQWFSDLAFGLQINWSLDVLLGASIGDHLAVSAKAYQDFYFNELPGSFHPKQFDPSAWATLARLAGAKYVLLPAKHHNGFCMWNTKTTNFNVMNTPVRRDLLQEMIEAFRTEGIAIGLSFSPDDYHVLYQQGFPPSRESEASTSTRNSNLWEINKQQINELLTNYGKIDLISIEEKSDWANPLVANYIWNMAPEVLVTRAGLETFDYNLPDKTMAPPWELRFSMSIYPQHAAEAKYKDATSIIEMLIATRANGGNLLLSAYPDAHGQFSAAQEDRLRETGLWLAANQEAIYTVKPGIISQEQGVWFTTSKDENTVYAFVNAPYWKWMEARAFFIRSLRGASSVSVLSQNDLMMEYQVQKSPKPIVSITDLGIFVDVIKAQRPTTNWSNPLVLKFEHATFSVATDK